MCNVNIDQKPPKAILKKTHVHIVYTLHKEKFKSLKFIVFFYDFSMYVYCIYIYKTFKLKCSRAIENKIIAFLLSNL